MKKTWLIVVILSAICVCCGGGMFWYCQTGPTAPHLNWSVRKSPRDLLLGVAFGNNMFVAVGNGGTILISPNGENRTCLPPVSDIWLQLNGITYGNGMFVAVGDRVVPSGREDKTMTSDGGTILISPNGENWTCLPTVDHIMLQGVTYGNGMFVAVGDGPGPPGSEGVVLTSTDGAHWALSAHLASDTELGCIAFGDGTFVVSGRPFNSSTPHATMWSSHDGVKWTSVQAPLGVGDWGVMGITFGNHLFLATTEHGSILTSSDGLSWATHVVSLFSRPVLRGVAYGNNTFVAVGSIGMIPEKPVGRYKNAVILTSCNGLSWKRQTLGVQGLLTGIAYGNHTFIAISDSGFILTSEDGRT